MNKSTKPTKRCSRCKKPKPLPEFGKNKATPDGLQVYCKKCKSKLDQAYRNRNKAKNTAKEQQQTGLIPIEAKTVSSQQIQTVNARGLHSFLESKQQFADWIKNRIKQYGFEENQDFIIFHNSMNNSKRGPKSKDYHLTLDMAKELSMVERNDKGREARRYFLQCEKIARGQAQPLPVPTPVQIPAIIETLTPAQQQEARKLVMEKAQKDVGDKKPNKGAYMKIYGSIKDSFQVETYSEVPRDRFDELVEFLGETEMFPTAAPENFRTVISEEIQKAMDKTVNQKSLEDQIEAESHGWYDKYRALQRVMHSKKLKEIGRLDGLLVTAGVREFDEKKPEEFYICEEVFAMLEHLIFNAPKVMDSLLTMRINSLKGQLVGASRMRSC